MPIEITMPRLSDTMEKGTIVKWHVAAGDSIESGDVLADVETERAVLGPGTLAKYERELAAVESLPVSDVDKDAALSLVLDFARAAARAFSHAARERDREAPGDWWDREGAVLAKLGVTDRFPLAARIGTAAGRAQGAAHDARRAYHFGLQVILDGLGSRTSR